MTPREKMYKRRIECRYSAASPAYRDFLYETLDDCIKEERKLEKKNKKKEEMKLEEEKIKRVKIQENVFLDD